MEGTEPANTHGQRALIDLRQRIVEGALPGGTRLYEVALADELGISRTPVREAMSRLAEEGLLERVRSGGFIVRSFALTEVIDTIELRGILEGTAARFAAERGVTEARMAPMREVLRQLDALFAPEVEVVDLDRYGDLNAEFHRGLAGLSGSAVIEAEIARVTRLPFASPSAFLPERTQIDAFRRTLAPAQAQHQALIEAITNREGARAEALAREHARAARVNVEAIFAADPGRIQRPMPGRGLIQG
jgi:GntR family transcriptional regulator, vanillate catabolism transcriptional regulator